MWVLNLFPLLNESCRKRISNIKNSQSVAFTCEKVSTKKEEEKYTHNFLYKTECWVVSL